MSQAAEPSVFSRLVSGGAIRTLNLVITIIISFFMLPFLVQNLGDKSYGLWALIGSLMGYYMVVDFGLLTASQRYLAKHLKEHDKLNEVINTSFVLLSFLSFCAMTLTGVFYSVAHLIVAELEFVPTLQTLILILGLKTILTLPLMVFNGMLSAKLRFDITATIEIVKNLIRAALVVAYITKGYSIVALAVITLVTELLGFVAISWFAIKLYPEASYGPQFVKRELSKELFQFGKYTFLGETSNLLKTRVDDIIIAKFIGLSSVTIYAIAFSLSTYASQFVYNITSGLTTVLTATVHEGNEALQRKFLIFTEVCTIVASFFTVIIILFGKSFISLWMGPEYFESYNLLIVFSIMLLIGTSNRACVPLFYAMSAHKKLAFWNLYEGLINVVLSIILIQKLGIIGVVIGTLIASLLFRLVFQINYACQLVHLNLTTYWRVLLKHWTIAAILLGLAKLFELAEGINSYLELILVGIGVCFFYIYTVSRFVISPQVKAIFIDNLQGILSPRVLQFIFGKNKL